jgi:hypothetical protein
LQIRRPTLADLTLASDSREAIMDRVWYERRRDQLRAAKKFVLDDQAAIYLATMLREHPRVIADAQDFAIPPFNLMWVELPFRSFYAAMTGEEPDSTSDTQVGYLIESPSVWVAAASEDHRDACFLPTGFVLHKPMTIEEQLGLADKLEVSRLGIDLWFWGESASFFAGGRRYVDNKTAWDKESLHALQDNHSVQFAPLKPKYQDKKLGQLLHGSAGDLRNIIGLLLFINRTRDITYEKDVPMAQSLIKRKPKPLMPHKVISIKLDPLPRLMKLAAGEGIRRRFHEVRGHFCHDETARAGCPHGKYETGDWGEWWEEYEMLRWRCTGCSGKRWWKPEHTRGSSDVGVIKEQTYAVTK